ncbi:MAG: AmmeMemoRadiSam system protein B [Bacteroidota bacterium]|nr:AmmeMemoRadiSam system protein B [Bacteroidota bacterium]
MNKTREAIAAGRFYSANAEQLRNDVEQYLDNSTTLSNSSTVALIVPHAGYVFSGQIAADAYKAIPKNIVYDNVFLIGSSHSAFFKGASVYSIGNYSTPLGDVKVNGEIAEELIMYSELFDYHPEAHTHEHSLEVQLPFLQVVFNNNLQIVPIILGDGKPSEYQEIAEVLKPYLNKNNLFVISTDFSHFPDSNSAVDIDAKTVDAIVSGDPLKLLDVLRSNKRANIFNLQTSLCGWTAVLTLLYLIDVNSFSYKKLTYRNSGDCKYGDKLSVVGYWSLIVERGSNIEFSLSDNEKMQLLKLARNTLEYYLEFYNYPELDTDDIPRNLKSNCGAFVTLTNEGELRGCMGRFENKEPLYKVVQDMVVAAAVDDHRFFDVTNEEIEAIEIEISVLTPLRKIDSINEIILGKHGVYIIKGVDRGTLLPQVVVNTGWTKEEFLGYCSRDKVGIGWEGWRSADIYVYEAIIINEDAIFS